MVCHHIFMDLASIRFPGVAYLQPECSLFNFLFRKQILSHYSPSNYEGPEGNTRGVIISGFIDVLADIELQSSSVFCPKLIISSSRKRSVDLADGL